MGFSPQFVRPLLVASIVLVSVLQSQVTPSLLASAQGAPLSCTGVLDGSRFAALMPTASTWEHLFRGAVSADQKIRGELFSALGFQPADVATVTRIASEALMRSEALQRSPRPAGAHAALQLDRDAEAARALLDGRDKLVRGLSASKMARLQEWIEDAARNMLYTFPVPGHWVSSAGVDRCGVSVNAVDHFHLIPEYYVWQLYFRMGTLAAETQRTGPFTHSAEHLVTLQQRHLRMPTSDIQLVVNVAIATTTAVDQARAAAQAQPEFNSLTLIATVAGIVGDARAELVRRLPLQSWMAVQDDVRNVLSGTTYDFPTGL